METRSAGAGARGSSWRQSPYLPGVAACVFGLLFAGIGGGLLLLNRLYRTEGRMAHAVVTQAGYSSGRSSVSWLTYRFRLPDGREIGGRQSGYTVRPGDTILVEYLPRLPGLNRVAGAGDQGQRYLLPITLAGAVFVLAGLGGLRRLHRLGRGTAPPG